MTTAIQVYSELKKWEGYRDNSGTKIWMSGPEPHWPGSAFCGKGQQVMSWAAGMLPAPMSSWSRYVYCPHVVTDGMNAGLRITSYKSNFMDLVLFDWASSGGRDGVADHIGRIIHNDPSLPYVTTFEFNTGDGETNGARGCFVRRRYRADILCCINMQSFYTGSTSAAPTTPAQQVVDQDMNKFLSTDDIKMLQKVLGVSQDGIAGKQTYSALQHAMGTPEDGVLSGSFSTCIKVMQQKIGHCKVDGIMGEETAKALVDYLKGGNTFGLAKPSTSGAPTSTPQPSTFPLMPGNYFSEDDKTPGSHNGIRANDAVVIKRIQSVVGAAQDGIYGPETASKVKQWQSSHGVAADGVVGPQTWAAMKL